MNITLVDTTRKVFATYVPLALLRLSSKHKILGDNVELITAGQKPKATPDIIYFSFIFLFDYKKDCEWVLTYKNKYPTKKIIIGGVSPTLIPEKFEKYLLNKNIEIFKGRDFELEKLKPDFNITGLDYSYGFTTRGCPNKCEWCVVPKIEGKQNIIVNWKEQIDITKRVFYAFDNNIYSCGSVHFENVLKYCHENNIKIDCNQGMDAEIFHKNKKIQEVFLKYPKVWENIRFAWDSDRVNDSIIFMMDFMVKYKIKAKYKLLYMLYDSDDSPETVFKRMQIVNNHPAKYWIKLMRFKDLETGKLLRKWGGIGDLIADALGFTITGYIDNSDFWKYMLSKDFNFFIDNATLLRKYIKSVKVKNTKEFIKFANLQLIK